MTFAKAADKTVAEEAFSLSSGDCGEFSWNRASTAMTFAPCSEWAYGAEVDVEVISTASHFRVLRQSTMKLYSEADKDGYITGKKGKVYEQEDHILVSTKSWGFVSFDLGQLPGDLAQIVSAELGFHVDGYILPSEPFDSGPLLIESLSYAELNKDEVNGAANPLCLRSCGPRHADARVIDLGRGVGWKSVDMTDAVGIDWQLRQARGSQSGFRLRYTNRCFSSGCNDKTTGIQFYSGESRADSPYLLVTFTHP